jgi:acyl-coenzyme A synthetase/AMP-(fatty) acid ligase
MHSAGIHDGLVWLGVAALSQVTVTMEVVKAFVALKDGFEPAGQLRRELLGFSREKLGAGVAPREIEFVASLPKTRSGKIMRRLLKARELGLPEATRAPWRKANTVLRTFAV